MLAYKHYIAIIGDIIESRKIIERNAAQEQLKTVLFGINEDFAADIAVPFTIVLGDGFQGLLSCGAHLLTIVETIEQRIYPVKLRLGLGVGQIITDIDPSMPLAADGPAYHNAREMVDDLKTAENKKKEAKSNVKIKIEGDNEISDLMNTVFLLNTVIKNKWTTRQREIIADYLQNGVTQIDIAKRHGINQSNVQKALSNANFYAYQKATLSLTAILSGIK
jgi:DNA-binding CsgD family transcriptional regulator